MNTVEIIDANTRINESCHIIDRGSISSAEIVIGEGLHVAYCFVAPKNSHNHTHYRHISIGANTIFTGTGVIIEHIDIEMITEITGDGASSTLDLLALATDDARISIEGVARVISPYRHVSTRVDQTNILIGSGARVRGVPRLEIATDDIEGGHSCRMHRLGGESLFYLTSRGLSYQDAETLLLVSEIQRHIRTLETDRREAIYNELLERLG